MRLRLVSACILAVFFIPVVPPVVSAQRVLGVGDDALVLPRGVFRFRTLGQWTEFNERYGMDTPGRPDGALEPLGIDFTLDTIGVKQFPKLATLQAGLQQLTGNPSWFATLGNTKVTLRDQVSAFPFIFEAGITKRFSIGIQVPYVRTNSTVSLNVNTTGIEGNLGFNPAAFGNATAAAQNAAMLSQFTADSTSLKNALDNCQANPAAPGCPQLNAQRTSATTLITLATAFARGVNSIFSTSPFVPIVGTDAQLTLEARVAAFKAAYANFAAFGVPPITSNGPFASQNRLTVADAQTILTDPAFGIAAEPLAPVKRSHLGDIDIGAKFSVYDSFDGSTAARMEPHGLNFRTAIGGMFRLPTGQVESPNNFVDLGTGRGVAAIEGRWFGDILVGSHFWQSIVVRYNRPFADKQDMRIIDLPNLELAPVYRLQSVDRHLGSTFEFETTPRIVLNNFFAVSGQYVYRHKGQDHYTGRFTIPTAVSGLTAPLDIDASTLDLETETREHRFGGGISFSNVYSFEKGKAKIPFEATYLHWQTTKGWGGNQPKFFTDQIQVRLYARIFGH